LEELARALDAADMETVMAIIRYTVPDYVAAGHASAFGLTGTLRAAGV
jgi:hypothetical protein